MTRTGTGRRRITAALGVVALGTVLLLSGGVLAAHLLGVRWFEVETPSMGETAPVGTLVVTVPVDPASLAVGDVVAFHPPGPGARVYTHRIVGMGDGRIETRGDLNGATDGWRIRPSAVPGRSVLLLPGAGFLLRGVPLLLAGNAVVWLATALVREPAPRQALRLVGFSLVVSVASLVVKPFVQVQVLAVSTTGDAVHAAVVSTGLLPITVRAVGTPGSVLLADGQAGTLLLPVGAHGYRLSAALELGAAGWAALVAICLLPLVTAVVVGLPGGGAPDRAASAA